MLIRRLVASCQVGNLLLSALLSFKFALFSNQAVCNDAASATNAPRLTCDCRRTTLDNRPPESEHLCVAASASCFRQLLSRWHQRSCSTAAPPRRCGCRSNSQSPEWHDGRRQYSVGSSRLSASNTISQPVPPPQNKPQKRPTSQKWLRKNVLC